MSGPSRSHNGSIDARTGVVAGTIDSAFQQGTASGTTDYEGLFGTSSRAAPTRLPRASGGRGLRQEARQHHHLEGHRAR